MLFADFHSSDSYLFFQEIRFHKKICGKYNTYNLRKYSSCCRSSNTSMHKSYQYEVYNNINHTAYDQYI